MHIIVAPLPCVILLTHLYCDSLSTIIEGAIYHIVYIVHLTIRSSTNKRKSEYHMCDMLLYFCAYDVFLIFILSCVCVFVVVSIISSLCPLLHIIVLRSVGCLGMSSTEVKKEIEFDDFVNQLPNANYKICGSVPNGCFVTYNRLLSPEFSCFGSKWRLEIVFLFKKTMLRKVPYVGLYLRYLSDKSIMIGFNMDIIHSKGKKRLSGKHFHKGLTTFDSCKNRMSCTLDSVFGTSDKFFPLRSLLRCLVDGTLILKVTMRALGDPFTMLLEREVPSSVVEDCPICKVRVVSRLYIT